MPMSTTLSPVVKDCSNCHGTGIVRVRFVINPHGKVRVITCPDCKGYGSWISGRDPRMVPVPYESAMSLLLQFSEWRDRDDFGRPDTSLPSHTDLISEFLAQRDQRALPAVEDVPQACGLER
jgi:hypothetical protein